MLTIYGVYRSRASRNLWLAGELGIPFKHVPVMQLYRLTDPAAAKGVLHTKSPEFLKVNPNGHVPSIDDDGLVLHESLAINLYLAKKHGGPLAPANVAEDGLMSMWALWAATEVEPHALTVLMHRVSKPPAERDPKIADAAIEALRAPFAVLDKALAATVTSWRPLHGGGYQRGRGVPLRHAGAGAVRGCAAGEGLAGGMPGAAGVQVDVGQEGDGACVRHRLEA
jgi:glutathione S-transferase